MRITNEFRQEILDHLSEAQRTDIKQIGYTGLTEQGIDKIKRILESEREAWAITELAVKGLKEIACLNVDSAYSAGTFARNTLSEIERLGKGIDK